MRMHTSLAVACVLNAPWLLPAASLGQEPARGNETQRPASASLVFTDDHASIQCIHKAHIAAQADGIVDRLLVDEGSTVKKGDLLLQIDDRVAQAEKGVATKELEAATKQAAQTANVEYAKKASEVSDAEYADIRTLYNQGAATYSEARKKQLEAERARLGIDVAEVEHQKEILAAEVAAEKLKASDVALMLHQAVAPFEGQISQRLRDQGEWVRAGEPILKLVHLREMRVVSNVILNGLSPAQLHGAPIRIEVPGVADRVGVIQANVEYVSPEVEMGRVRVWTRIPNVLVAGVWMLGDGMTAKVEIIPQPLAAAVALPPAGN